MRTLKRLPLCLAVLCIGLFLTPTSAGAQTPAGYLGKRQAVELELDFNPWVLTVDPTQYGLRSAVGVGASYHYVYGSRAAVGLNVSYRNFGKPTFGGGSGGSEREAPNATTEVLAVVELCTFGSRGMPGIAPLGGKMIYGLGVASYSGTPYVVSRNGRFSDERVSVITPVLRLGYGYRYVFKDRFSVQPWARVDLSPLNFGGYNGDTLNAENPDEVPILPHTLGVIWRAGVSVGVLL